MAETRKVFPPSLALLNLGNKKLYLQNLVLRECTELNNLKLSLR